MGIMNEAVREYAETQRIEGWIEGIAESKIATVRNMFKNNVPLETVLKYAGINMETYERYTQRRLSAMYEAIGSSTKSSTK